MLSRSRRLRAADVVRVIKSGSGSRGRYLSVKTIAGEGKMLRCAAVIGKSVAKQAVLRNRARRALYRAIGSAPADLGLWAVFFINRVPEKEIENLFRADVSQLLRLKN